MINGKDLLVYLSYIYEGDWDKIYNSIQARDAINVSEDEILIAKSKISSKYITILDDEYPYYLKQITKPPFVLFYYGDISLLRDLTKNLSVIGSRDNTEYGYSIAQELIPKLCKYFNIVSGMAQGIDRLAHYFAMKNGGKTIAVLGSGVDYCFPSRNCDIYEDMKKNHLILSEYPNNTPPDRSHFPIRNRIIAGLSGGTLIIESKLRSGTMITANYALTFGKEVMCVPAMANKDSGCNYLIKYGATLIETADDVIYQLGSQKNLNFS